MENCNELKVKRENTTKIECNAHEFETRSINVKMPDN